MTMTTLLIKKTSMMLGNIFRYKHNIWNEMAIVTKTKDREQSKGNSRYGYGGVVKPSLWAKSLKYFF